MTLCYPLPVPTHTRPTYLDPLAATLASQAINFGHAHMDTARAIAGAAIGRPRAVHCSEAL